MVGGRQPLEHGGDRVGEGLLTQQALVETRADLGDGVLERVEAGECVGGGGGRGASRHVTGEGRDAIGALALDQRGDPLLGAFGGGLGLRPCHLHLLLRDLGVGGERGELAADLALDVFDPLLQFVQFDDRLGGLFVAEEAVDRVRVDDVGVVDVSWFAEHGVVP